MIDTNRGALAAIPTLLAAVLALALSSENAEERAAAESAMRGIRHVREHFAQWFGSEQDFLARLPDVFFIGFQETLAAIPPLVQWARSKSIPIDLEIKVSGEDGR